MLHMHRLAAVLLFFWAASAVASQSQPPASASTKSLGVAVAPIIIEVFSDYQFPACKALYEQTLQRLIHDYVNRRKVFLVHRDYPLPVHPYAREAACYACAAERVGKYEQACEVLFRQQSSWSKDGKVGDVVCSILTPAEARKVRALAASPEVFAEVNRDIQLGRSNGIQQTPTMIISHKNQRYPAPGVISYPVLQRFLDDLLSK